MANTSDNKVIYSDSFSWFGLIAINENGGVYQDDSSAVKIPVNIIQVVCLMVSVVGNLCTCAVIVRDRSMRTPTNCYLFNLAITDLTTTLFIPVEIYLVWAPESYPLGKIGCVIHILIWDCLSNCSLLTIAAFTVERYLAVAKPFLRHTLTRKSRVYKIVALNWLVSACFSVPDLFLIHLHQNKEKSYCLIIIPFHLKLIMVTEMFVFFVMPMTIIFVLYILIAIKIKSIYMFNKTSPVNGKQYRDKTIKMLAAVAATFFFCWFPYFLLRLVLVTSKQWINHNYDHAVRALRYVSLVNAYIFAAVNPILYSLMSRKFSRAFKDLLSGRKSRSSIFTAATRKATTTPRHEILLKELSLPRPTT